MFYNNLREVKRREGDLLVKKMREKMRRLCPTPEEKSNDLITA